jgi:hypothetical protein
MRRIAALALLLCGFAGQAEAGCSVPRFKVTWDVQNEAYTTLNGGSCRVRVDRTSGTTEIRSVTVAAAARNGSTTASGLGVVYRPRAGFKGEDSFLFALNGRRAGVATHATVRVNVTVN